MNYFDPFYMNIGMCAFNLAVAFINYHCLSAIMDHRKLMLLESARLAELKKVIQEYPK